MHVLGKVFDESFLVLFHVLVCFEHDLILLGNIWLSARPYPENLFGRGGGVQIRDLRGPVFSGPNPFRSEVRIKISVQVRPVPSQSEKERLKF